MTLQLATANIITKVTFEQLICPHQGNLITLWIKCNMPHASRCMMSHVKSKSQQQDQQSRAASGSLHLFAARKISSRTPKVQNPDRAYTVCCTWHTDQPQCNPSSAQVLKAQGSCQLFSIQTKQHKHPNGFEIWSQTMTPDSNRYCRPSSCRLR